MFCPGMRSSSMLGRAATAIAVLVFVFVAGTAQVPAAKERAQRATTAVSTSERLRYRATWNGLPVADAELLIAPAAARRAVQLKGRAETNEALDLLWRMRDSFEATVATDPPAPERFLLRQHENDHRRETTVTSDAGNLVGSKRKRDQTPKVAMVALRSRVHDPASLAYLIRTLPPELASVQTYEVFTGTKSYRVTVKPAGDETIDVIGRHWPARKLRLSLELIPTDEKPSGAEGAVQNADLWVSSGPERLPLRMQAESFWGWVTVELTGRS